MTRAAIRGILTALILTFTWLTVSRIEEGHPAAGWMTALTVLLLLALLRAASVAERRRHSRGGH